MRSIAIIIPFYNGNEFIEKLLDSIEKQSISEFIDTIIIDNSNSGERIKVNKKKYLKNITIIHEKPNLGFGSACNSGFQYAKNFGYEFILIVNQDAFFDKNTVELLHNAILKTPYSIVSPVIRTYSKGDIENFYIVNYYSHIPNLFNDALNGNLSSMYEIEKLNGACFMLKVSDFESIPYLFDPIFFMYYEDNDLYERIKKNKIKSYVVPHAFFYHAHSNTDPKQQNFRFRANRLASEQYYFLKHFDSKIFLKGFFVWQVKTARVALVYLLYLDFKGLAILALANVKVYINTRKIYKSRKIEFKD